MSLLLKGAIEELPPTRRKSGFYSRYFAVPKKDGGLHPILDLRRLNLRAKGEQFQDANSKVHLVSDPTPRLVCDHDIKDGYFHIQIVKRQEFPQVCFRGQSLPILCSPVWTGTGPPNIYKVYGRSSGPVAAFTF